MEEHTDITEDPNIVNSDELQSKSIRSACNSKSSAHVNGNTFSTKPTGPTDTVNIVLTIAIVFVN